MFEVNPKSAEVAQIFTYKLVLKGSYNGTWTFSSNYSCPCCTSRRSEGKILL